MIREFQGQYRFLSNFWPVTIWFNGDRYQSVEHAYQASKVDRAGQVFIQALTPGAAKRYTRGIPRPANAEFIMFTLVRQKFTEHNELRALLKDTGTEELQEGNRWGDSFWGVNLNTGIGQNKLGKILMDIRGEL